MAGGFRPIIRVESAIGNSGSDQGRVARMRQAMRDLDLELMHRCIALGASSVKEGEYPFAAVIASNGSFVCESINRVKRDRDVNRHAEVIAIFKAQLAKGTNLSDCTIYSTVEPCAQCSYALPEARLRRDRYWLRTSLQV